MLGGKVPRASPLRFIYNPLPHTHTFSVALPLALSGAVVTFTNKTIVPSVVVPFVPIYKQALAARHPTNCVITTYACRKTRLVHSWSFAFGDWGALEYKLHNSDPSVVVEWTVGPIPIADHQGRETIVRFDTSIASEKTWYTDSNGLDFVKRVRNCRETWNLSLHDDEEAVAANYVPITMATYVRDKSTQFNVVTGRAQGVACSKEGSVDIMVHRRLLEDDHKGVDEHLNETETLLANGQRVTQGLTVRGAFALSVGPLDDAMVLLGHGAARPTRDPQVLIGSLAAQYWYQVAASAVSMLRAPSVDRFHEHPEWSKEEISLTGNRKVGAVNGTTVTLQALHVKAFEVCHHKDDTLSLAEDVARQVLGVKPIGSCITHF
ncbi:Aste57867_8435 [Aphanomyces stellatus]|uniref:Aste57867_8435 protein n=1 Tax=Aphanomyces stellatus TaxID=120398 RepID=A0A485KKB6_9STRA|nr:hypothetical protein As57867_008403 [Aphanomyces stellatus]VFT85321.1 Aste57867_8435 [Aphanomyces stellatus]